MVTLGGTWSIPIYPVVTQMSNRRSILPDWVEGDKVIARLVRDLLEIPDACSAQQLFFLWTLAYLFSPVRPVFKKNISLRPRYAVPIIML